MDGVKVWKIY